MCIWRMNLQWKVVVRTTRKCPISAETQLSAANARIKHTPYEWALTAAVVFEPMIQNSFDHTANCATITPLPWPNYLYLLN